MHNRNETLKKNFKKAIVEEINVERKNFNNLKFYANNYRRIKIFIF